MPKAREWTTIDKSEWGEGAWQNEPDKRQWVDPATGYDCLMVRTPLHGGWCGYVGVPEKHPLFAVGYSQCPEGNDCPEGERPWCDHTPESTLDVHGGITFADRCHEPTKQEWSELPAKLEHYHKEWGAEAEKYPHGDAAQLIASLERQVGMTYEEWREDQMAQRICHLPRPEVGEVWWFGFDCAHSGDFSPASQASMKRIAPDLARGQREWEQYRDVEYVEFQVAHLARQLKALEK